MDKELAIEKGLIIGEDASLYTQLQNAYKKLFIEFLLSNTKLQEYDNQIDTSDLGFKPVEMKDNSIANNTIGEKSTPTEENKIKSLKYFFLLNRFYIERLSVAEIETLRTYSTTGSNYTEEMYNFVISTINRVSIISYKGVKKLDETSEICYGTPTSDNVATNGTVVLSLEYNNDFKTENYDEFIGNYNTKLTLIKSIKNAFEAELNKHGIKYKLINFGS